MRKAMLLLGFALQCINSTSQMNEFAHYPVYTGNDLGLTYTPAQSSFKIWAPTATEVSLQLYTKGVGEEQPMVIALQADKNGSWKATVKGDHIGKFYTFKVNIRDKGWQAEVPDPYARAAGLNGKRAMVVHLPSTNPPGWEKDKSPAFTNTNSAIIYELQIRDASIADNSGIQQKGKFLGLTEQGTVNKEGLATGLDHLKEMGVTHIHLLPFYDLNSIDESKPSKPQYNWGYDPVNYNLPEGSFSTDASNGMARIKELKQLVQAFHQNGLRVVMDVVYNHTALTEGSNFNQLVSGYYYRQTADGKFSNATACGNETASERPMMRKFMLESMRYWMQEYHIDGFRVDLMGVHDIVTMNAISKELHRLRPDVLLYGEGWTAGSSPLPDSLRALKKNAAKLDRIAVFSDDIRDGIKGSVFEHTDKGFASGKPGMEESVKFGIVASCKHPQVQYSKVNYSKAPYAAQPYQTVTYAECHDNHVLWDKLGISAAGATEQQRVSMHKLALSIVLTSQGIAFLHAGTEFLRSKKGVENSFDSPDSINEIDWGLKTKHRSVVDYVKDLIRIRKEHPAFRMTKASDIAKNLQFIDKLEAGMIAYTIDGAKLKDRWKKILVVFNGNEQEKSFTLPGNTSWNTAVRDNSSEKNTAKSSVIIAPFSCSIFYQ